MKRLGYSGLCCLAYAQLGGEKWLVSKSGPQPLNSENIPFSYKKRECQCEEEHHIYQRIYDMVQLDVQADL